MNLAAEMAKLPEPPNNSKPPLWDAWRHQLWHLAQTDNPHNFTKWPPIHHCMLVDHWKNIVESAEMPLTKPVLPALLADQPNPSDGLNRIHQAYHILRWQEATGLNIADMQSVYEFGGGYGAMALVCNRLGFRGRYYIYDLPEFELLQRWYLEGCGINNVVWTDKDAFGDVDLLIACYSLSETDFDERDRILKAWQANSYLFLYSNKFEQYDNIEYFQNLEYSATIPNWQDTRVELVPHWQHSHIDHLPPESWYSFGY